MHGVTTKTIVGERVTDALCRHGEGPVWDARSGSVRWVDMVNGDVLTLGTVTAAAPTRTHVADFVAALRPRARGGWVLATERGFALTDASLAVERHLPAFGDETAGRMNDGGCDPFGNFLCGTAGADGAGRLYRLSPTGEIDVVLHGLTISNGLAAEPHGRFLYFVDTPTRRVDRIELVDGLVGARHPFVDLSGQPGLPDGIAVDAEGGVWVAMWGGSAVLHFDAEGVLRHRVVVPTPHVSACAFGGERLSELYVTTSRLGLQEPGELEFAGALFRAEVPVAGCLPREFAG